MQQLSPLALLTLALFCLLASPGLAESMDISALLPLEVKPGLSNGDTAWMLTATALVLFMTLPGLALFYGGLVPSKSVLSVFMHCITIACIASLIWFAGGYSLAFTDGGSMNGWIGSLSAAFLNGVSSDSLSGTIPQYVFFMFQMTFAIITPALVVGAWVERMHFPAVIWFSVLFLVLIYIPVTHWVWGGGWLSSQGVLDFAGGLVVHATAGTSALVLACSMRQRLGFPSNPPLPHSPGMTMTGASMLWVGWFGFNAGSALAANGDAGSAMVATHIAAATASLVWLMLDRIMFGKSTLIGLITGTIAGLASITPASGFVGPQGAIIIGLVGGLLCYAAVILVKKRLKIDDSLDVFAVHGVGGIVGTILVAPLAATFDGAGLKGTIGQQLIVQLTGIISVIAWTAAATFLILALIKTFSHLSVSQGEETEGLDAVAHGEKGYHLR